MAEVTENKTKWRGIGGASPLSVGLGTVPALLLIGLFLGVPAILALRLSMSRWSGYGSPEFVGFKNYVEAFASNGFWGTVLLTIWFAAICSILTTIVAILLASAVNQKVKGHGFYKVIWFLPGLAPGAAVGIFWANSFLPDQGVFNIIRGWFGLSTDTALLSDPSTAFGPIIFVSVWASVGFSFLILLGAMQQIPRNLYEASRLDGATPRDQLWTITLPLVRPTVGVLLILAFIGSFNNFTTIWAMTRGGPGDATSILPVQVYVQAFQFTNFGPAAALAVIGSVFLIVVGGLGLRLSRSSQSS